ncbi:hypothetical protein KK141_11200 [Dyella sp. LX-66]|uniref:hypothetical protein n=1 Tax=unclassified Dyella TaxID=2634549 RepID=UPI001BE0229A|nr:MULTISPECIES: hypothetical protein [unclassified Dyella]MBT2118909.1 hypothetical protein [Dyella sp. LX-1]MBT2140097.1 hypothetical protein [Dyella sp. LX-66]
MTEVVAHWPFERHTLPAGEVWHTYRTIYGPLSANPWCDTRFALAGAPGEPNRRPAFYCASGSTGAIWEVVLRNVRPNAHNEVYVAPAELAGRSVARLRLRRDLTDIVRVDPPHRRRFVDADTVEDLAWETACTHSVHALSQGMAAGLDRFLAAHGVTLGGLGWHSRQYQDDLVHVLFAPPLAEDDWEVLEEIPLDSPAGLALVRAAVEAAGYRWIVPPLDAPNEPELPA